MQPLYESRFAPHVKLCVRATGRRALVVQADVAQEPEVLTMFDAVDAGLGRLTGLVNNAGVVDHTARVDEMSVARLQRMWAVNLTGSFVCPREALRRRSRRHGGPGGAIVTLSSAAVRLGSPTQSNDYSASKRWTARFTLGRASRGWASRREIVGGGRRGFEAGS